MKLFSQRIAIGLSAVWGLCAGYPEYVSGQELLRSVVDRTSEADLQFTVAPGLQISKAMVDGLVSWPIVADWDFDGNLLVVESGGVAKPIEEHNKKLLHRIVRLSDRDQDGVFDHRSIVVDELPFTEGVLCLGNEILAAAPPNIWKFSDIDGDGVCERREVWFDGQTITGCANDLHGPYLGPDGWVYWCKGAFAEQSYTLRNGDVLTDSAAHLYRRPVSGGAIDCLMSGGMDNPVEVAFSPEGERFFTSTFLVHPGDGHRDGVAHAVYGGVYGKDHAVLQGLPRTGSLLPVMTLMEAAAPSGITCLQSGTLGNSGAGNLAVALFNLQKVVGLSLTPEGATFRAESRDLVLGSRIDFHPTDVLEDQDGSLIVVDTGGWYDLCCPTSRIDQKTAPGGLYRLSRSGEKVPSREAISWDGVAESELVRRLSDPRPWVNRRSLLTLADRGSSSVAALNVVLKDAGQSIQVRQQAIWGLVAVGTQQALDHVIEHLDDTDDRLVQTACQGISLHRYAPARDALERLVGNAARSGTSRGAVTRAALEALGRIGDSRSLGTIFQVLDRGGLDRMLEHSLYYAAYEINAPAELAEYLVSAVASQRKAAMVVLDMLNDRKFLSAELVVQALTEKALAEPAIQILESHPDWAADCLSTLSQIWQAGIEKGAPPSAELAALLRAWSEEPGFEQQGAEWLEQSASGTANFLTVQPWLAVLLSSRERTGIPAAWVEGIVGWIDRNPETVLLLRNISVNNPEHQELVERIDFQIECADSLEQQLDLLESFRAEHKYQNGTVASRLLELLEDEVTRSRGWHGLERLVLSEDVGALLLGQLDELPASDLGRAVQNIASIHSDRLDRQTLEKLLSLPTARTLDRTFLENVYRNQQPEIRKLASATADALQQSDVDIVTAVEAAMQSLPPGDAVRGLGVFRGSKANCASCHQMGYLGGKVGPELTKIGRSRTRNALLEAILFPSARIEQGYQPVQVLTAEGQVHNGLVIDQLGGRIRLQIGAREILEVELDQIEQRRDSLVSIMPQGMGEVLSLQELADLLKLLEESQ